MVSRIGTECASAKAEQMSKRLNDKGLQSNVGRQEHPADPGSRRHEPLCRVVEFGMNSVDGQKPEESGAREICQVPGC